MKDRKIYDKERARKLYADFIIRRENVMKLLGGCCYLCGKKAEKGFHLHHIQYHPIESNYPKHSKSMNIRIKRLKEAEQSPERFLLLCAAHHSLVEIIKARKVDLDKLKELL